MANIDLSASTGAAVRSVGSEESGDRTPLYYSLADIPDARRVGHPDPSSQEIHGSDGGSSAEIDREMRRILMEQTDKQCGCVWGGTVASRDPTASLRIPASVGAPHIPGSAADSKRFSRYYVAPPSINNIHDILCLTVPEAMLTSGASKWCHLRKETFQQREVFAALWFAMQAMHNPGIGTRWTSSSSRQNMYFSSDGQLTPKFTPIVELLVKKMYVEEDSDPMFVSTAANPGTTLPLRRLLAIENRAGFRIFYIIHDPNFRSSSAMKSLMELNAQMEEQRRTAMATEAMMDGTCQSKFRRGRGGGWDDGDGGGGGGRGEGRGGGGGGGGGNGSGRNGTVDGMAPIQFTVADAYGVARDGGSLSATPSASTDPGASQGSGSASVAHAAVGAVTGTVLESDPRKMYRRIRLPVDFAKHVVYPLTKNDALVSNASSFVDTYDVEMEGPLNPLNPSNWMTQAETCALSFEQKTIVHGGFTGLQVWTNVCRTQVRETSYSCTQVVRGAARGGADLHVTEFVLPCYDLAFKYSPGEFHLGALSGQPLPFAVSLLDVTLDVQLRKMSLRMEASARRLNSSSSSSPSSSGRMPMDLGGPDHGPFLSSSSSSSSSSQSSGESDATIMALMKDIERERSRQPKTFMPISANNSQITLDSLSESDIKMSGIGGAVRKLDDENPEELAGLGGALRVGLERMRRRRTNIVKLSGMQRLGRQERREYREILTMERAEGMTEFVKLTENHADVSDVVQKMLRWRQVQAPSSFVLMRSSIDPSKGRFVCMTARELLDLEVVDQCLNSHLLLREMLNIGRTCQYIYFRFWRQEGLDYVPYAIVIVGDAESGKSWMGKRLIERSIPETISMKNSASDQAHTVVAWSHDAVDMYDEGQAHQFVNPRRISVQDQQRINDQKAAMTGGVITRDRAAQVKRPDGSSAYVRHTYTCESNNVTISFTNQVHVADSAWGSRNRFAVAGANRQRTDKNLMGLNSGVSIAGPVAEGPTAKRSILYSQILQYIVCMANKMQCVRMLPPCTMATFEIYMTTALTALTEEFPWVANEQRKVQRMRVRCWNETIAVAADRLWFSEDSPFYSLDEEKWEFTSQPFDEMHMVELGPLLVTREDHALLLVMEYVEQVFPRHWHEMLEYVAVFFFGYQPQVPRWAWSSEAAMEQAMSRVGAKARPYYVPKGHDRSTHVAIWAWEGMTSNYRSQDGSVGMKETNVPVGLGSAGQHQQQQVPSPSLSSGGNSSGGVPVNGRARFAFPGTLRALAQYISNSKVGGHKMGSAVVMSVLLEMSRRKIKHQWTVDEEVKDDRGQPVIDANGVIRMRRVMHTDYVPILEEKLNSLTGTSWVYIARAAIDKAPEYFVYKIFSACRHKYTREKGPSLDGGITHVQREIAMGIVYPDVPYLLVTEPLTKNEDYILKVPNSLFVNRQTWDSMESGLVGMKDEFGGDEYHGVNLTPGRPQKRTSRAMSSQDSQGATGGGGGGDGEGEEGEQEGEYINEYEDEGGSDGDDSDAEEDAMDDALTAKFSATGLPTVSIEFDVEDFAWNKHLKNMGIPQKDRERFYARSSDQRICNLRRNKAWKAPVVNYPHDLYVSALAHGRVVEREVKELHAAISVLIKDPTVIDTDDMPDGDNGIPAPADPPTIDPRSIPDRRAPPRPKRDPAAPLHPKGVSGSGPKAPPPSRTQDPRSVPRPQGVHPMQGVASKQRPSSPAVRSAQPKSVRPPAPKMPSRPTVLPPTTSARGPLSHVPRSGGSGRIGDSDSDEDSMLRRQMAATRILDERKRKRTEDPVTTMRGSKPHPYSPSPVHSDSSLDGYGSSSPTTGSSCSSYSSDSGSDRPRSGPSVADSFREQVRTAHHDPQAFRGYMGRLGESVRRASPHGSPRSRKG